MLHSVLGPSGIGTSTYIITHVFCPLDLPETDDHSVYNHHSLARTVATAARFHSDHVSQEDIFRWNRISRMLENLEAIIQFERMDERQTISQLSSMEVGDVLAFPIRAQNAGVVFRKQKDVTIFESFELSPKAEDVLKTQGKLVCSYPGPAIEISNDVFEDENFLSELVNFLIHMDHDDLGTALKLPSFKDTAHPRYITELLTGILRSVGRPAEITGITKRLDDDVVHDNSKSQPWRRSSLWLLIRVALQTTLDRSHLGHHTYKEFMLFLMCCLAEEKTCTDLPSDLLHFMSAKISRRLRKLGPSAPGWLSKTALEACTLLRSILESRWKEVQAAQRVSPIWNPSELDLAQDIQLSFLNGGEYLQSCLADRGTNPPNVPFNPKHHPRGTLDDFLSNKDFFTEAYRDEPHVALYDVESAIEQSIDAWVDRVTYSYEALEGLVSLACKYASSASKTYASNPEHLSMMLLTTIELWIALDRIAVKRMPKLADYPPGIPTSLLENLLLYKAASLRRLRQAHAYLSHRHSQSEGQLFVVSPTEQDLSVRLRTLRAQVAREIKSEARGYYTYKLPNGPYKELQKYVDSTSHTSNEVIANQADRHKDLSIHEYMAFGHLRCGDLLQWLNILRELRGRSLSFHHPEVHMLLAQAVTQVGPLGGADFKRHEEIQQPTFCHALLAELRSLTHDIEANWKEAVTMDTISLLLRRVLAANPNDSVTSEAMNLLRVMRRKIYSWVLELSAKLTRVPGDGESRRVLQETAAICRSTFDLDPAIVPDILRSVEDLKILLACGMAIRDHMPSEVSRLPIYSQLLLDRDRRLSLALESVVSNAIQADPTNESINLAVRAVWSNYHPGSRWIPFKTPNSCWFACMTGPPPDQRPQIVHFNVLDGSLFVDGKPLGTWLPNNYMEHPLYKLVFGEQLLQVVQSNLPGMDYSTRGTISDHQVSFSLRNDGSDLVIQAKQEQRNSADIGAIQLIPYEKLRGDLPAVLIEGHAHWLNLATSILEVRPLCMLWVASSGNWRIDCTPGRYRMWKGREHLVDFRSLSWRMVSGLLKPLDTPENFIISASPVGLGQSLQLSAALPRYDLSFYIDEDGDLHSRNIESMVYDKEQSIGTLFGLVNQLVLRPKIRDVDAINLTPRCVIIPDGDVSFQMDGYHVRVDITTPPSSLAQITYQTYRINTDLGCLIGNSSLTSRLYCAYLHALTSGCSVDLLTGRSGTEEALSVLLSASCCPNVKFSPRDGELLKSIASICRLQIWNGAEGFARRVHSPNLLASLQSYELYTLSEEMKERYEKIQVFYDKKLSDLFKSSPLNKGHLPRRVAQQAAYLSPLGFSSQSLEPILDAPYLARHYSQADLGEQRAYIAATHACHHRGTATSTVDLLKMMKLWGQASGNVNLSLQYDRSWLVPDISQIWLRMYDLLRANDERKWYQLTFSLPAMAYASPNLGDLVPVFACFASYAQFRLVDPPHYDSYPISMGCHPAPLPDLRKYITRCAYPLERSSDAYLEHDGHTEGLRQRQVAKYDARILADADTTAKMLLAAWPFEILPPCSLDPRLYDVVKLTSELEDHFSPRFHNLKLEEHLTHVQRILNDLRSKAFEPRPDTSPYSFDHPRSISARIPWQLFTDQLFTRPAPALRACDRLLLRPGPSQNVDNSVVDCTPLHHLIDILGASAVSQFQHKYVSALRTSTECFRSELVPRGATVPATARVLEDHYARCRVSYTEALHRVQEYLSPRTQSEQAVERGGQWPCITAQALFRCLASNSQTTLAGEWKRCLIKLILLALELQRARRLLLLFLDNDHEEFRKELQNEGCDGWDAEAHPDWLLVQLQGNFLIRRAQVEVANKMISPDSGGNTVMQLNMGEGKTSVIVPVIAATLADGDQLVRVIVPRPLVSQTLHILADRLGGLTNRRIYHVPFSRSLEIDQKKIASLRGIMMECMRERGILVMQPEHVLSLKLVSVERQFSRANGRQLAELFLDLQKWLRTHSRDILDESDGVLDVRFQLVFTVGNQRHVEGGPERWTTTQQVLGLVSKYASSLQESFPLGVEYERRSSGSFPHLRILQADAGQKLLSQIIQDTVEGHVPNFSWGQFLPDLGDAIRQFVSRQDVPPATVQQVREHFKRTPLWGTLLLLRGLLANGILLFAFTERRWRVDYGLYPTRTMLAVPYRAKDTPAPRADFGHPDIAIILTCLSYYYDGLNEEQLRLCFEILSKQQDPSFDYSIWVGDYSGVPEFLWTLTGINLESVEQWNKIVFPLFSRNKATVDFYLAKVVFQKEAKEFPSKLPTSGWDLAEKKVRLLTGFSGTNDGQYLLPLYVTQQDPEHQRGTNAKVLLHILQPENRHYMCMTQMSGERLTIHEFLKVLVSQNPEIRVLLDVGAQMLGLQNHEVAKAWLAITSNASAAIYFNEDDELTVCTQDGSIELLRSSTFAQQINRCVVYLDDAHTRGTDIKFPRGFRAAVTLGPKIPKDRLVQGCMRMRRLGHGHSVMFFAPVEVDLRIRSVAGKGPSDVINSTDILRWAIRETWVYVQRWAPHWAMQGTDHASRYAVWTGFHHDWLSPKRLATKWLQPEAKTLEDLYAPRDPFDLASLSDPDVRQRCVDLGAAALYSVGMDEEQEREVIHESNLQLDTRRPPPARVSQVTHSVRRNVIDFVKTGVVKTGSTFFWRRSFKLAFNTLNKTSAAASQPNVWSQSVLTTIDFERTVRVSGKRDDYLRPVHWIVSASNGPKELLVILSPHEVNYLLPHIKSSKNVHLHLYTPRMAKSLKSCDDLALYNIPTVPDGWAPPAFLMDELNAFAGQLYLKDYETYVLLCHFLCMQAGSKQGDDGIKVGPKGYPRIWLAHMFSKKTCTVLRALMELRCGASDFTSTDMGKILSGRPLYRRDFDANSKPLTSNDDRLRDERDLCIVTRR